MRKILFVSLLFFGSVYMAQDQEELILYTNEFTSSDIDFQDEDGNTALINAILDEDDFQAIRLLIEQSSNLDIQNNHGATALMGAIFLENIDVIKLLIKYGADVNLKMM